MTINRIGLGYEPSGTMVFKRREKPTMSNINLLEETLEIFFEKGVDSKDIEWIGGFDYECTWEEFKVLADREYDAGFGGQEVASNLVIVFKDFWLGREEYDGAENWAVYEKPDRPTNPKKIEHLFGGWSTLSDIHEQRLFE